MLWFLTIHIIALLFWVASLLYLFPLVIASRGSDLILPTPDKRDSMARFIFTNITSPAAMVAITAGTAIFLINNTVTFWLVAKLTLVTALVVAHALTGLVLLKIDTQTEKTTLWQCGLLGTVILALVLAIIWIVLGKPPTPEWIRG